MDAHARIPRASFNLMAASVHLAVEGLQLASDVPEWSSPPRASPCSGRLAELAPESATEGGISQIAHRFGDRRQRSVTAAQQIGCNQHPPLSEVLDRRAAHELQKAIRQNGPGCSRHARELFDRPIVRGALMQGGQCDSYNAVTDARAPPPG